MIRFWIQSLSILLRIYWIVLHLCLSVTGFIKRVCEPSFSVLWSNLSRFGRNFLGRSNRILQWIHLCFLFFFFSWWLFIAASISLLVIDLLKWFISSWLNFGMPHVSGSSPTPKIFSLVKWGYFRSVLLIFWISSVTVVMSHFSSTVWLIGSSPFA